PAARTIRVRGATSRTNLARRDEKRFLPSHRGMSTTLPPLVFRCDAGFALGTGHVMRCLALAQGWQDIGGEVVFATREMPVALRERLRAEGITVVQLGGDAGEQDAVETLAIIRERRARWVVADGYRFTLQWQRSVRDAGCRVLAFDDH